MDINKVKSLIASITENLHDASIGEVLFLHHVSMETLDMMAELEGEEIYMHLAALEQSIYNEIHRRVDLGQLDLSDPQDFYGKLKQYYEAAEQSKFGEDIKASFLNMKRKRGKKTAVDDFKTKLTSHGTEFFERYRKELGLKTPKKTPKIPSPSDIINGKSRGKDIPNN